MWFVDGFKNSNKYREINVAQEWEIRAYRDGDEEGILELWKTV